MRILRSGSRRGELAVARSRFQERGHLEDTRQTHTHLSKVIYTLGQGPGKVKVILNKHTQNKSYLPLATWQVSGLRCFTFTFYFEALLAYVCQSFNTQQHTPLLEFLFRNTELRVESRLVHQTLPRSRAFSPHRIFLCSLHAHQVPCMCIHP